MIGPGSESTIVLRPDVTRIVIVTTAAGGGATAVAEVAAGAKTECVIATEKGSVRETESGTESGNAAGHALAAAPGLGVEVGNTHTHTHNGGKVFS